MPRISLEKKERLEKYGGAAGVVQSKETVVSLKGKIH
jgi:hypothetical protein